MTIPSAEAQQIEQEIRRLSEMTEAYIDASSMILCNKAGILDRLSGVCLLRTVASVLAETTYDDAPVIVDADPGTWTAEDAQATSQNVSGLSGPDLALLTAAVRSRLPIISDDLALLRAFSTSGLACFNSLMMVNLLVVRGALTPSELEESLTMLLRFARYNPGVIAYARQIRIAIVSRA
jgi:hypothetical protein